MPDRKTPSNHKRRIDVMISSTSKDLPDHRKQIVDAALRCKLNPLAMEQGTATNEDAIAFSLRLVDEAEIYVGVFAHRYGYIPDDARNPDKVSITEMEYRRARERNIPILIFVMSDEHPMKAGDIDKDPEKVEKLGKLRDEIMTRHVVGLFDSPEHLRTLALQALVEQRDKLLDTDAELEEASLRPEPKPTMPHPPELYALPPYTLTTSGFVGRHSELGELDEWAKSDDNVLVIEAIGGQGKSALAWEWVNDRANDFEGVFWYSFYEQGADMSGFMLHALAYLSRSDPETLKSKSRYELQTALLTRLQSGQYLLVLDGFERVLVAYHRWNAAQMRDDRVKADDDHRACTDPRDADLLRALAGCRRSRFLITSRLMPRELGDSDLLIAGVQTKPLGGLQTPDARHYLENLGVKRYEPQTLDRFVEQLGGHSLLLKIIAGKITRFHRGRGDFDAWYAQEGHGLHLAEWNISERRSHILQYALDGLTDEVRLLLSQIAAIGDAVSYETLAVFNPYVRQPPEKIESPDSSYEYFLLKSKLNYANHSEAQQHLQKQIYELELPYKMYQQAQAEDETYRKSDEYRKALAQFDAALTELEERGLIQWERENDNYDLHPVVRGYAFDLLEDEQRSGTYERLHGYFTQMPAENTEQARTLGELKNTIHIYQMLIGAGRLDDAAAFYSERLSSVLEYQIAAYYKIIELLTPFFPDGFDNLPILSNKTHQTNQMTNLANALSYIGQFNESLLLRKQQILFDLEERNASDICTCLNNYALTVITTGKLAVAWHIIDLCKKIAILVNNKDDLYSTYYYSLILAVRTGQWEAAEDAYNACQAVAYVFKTQFLLADVYRQWAMGLVMRKIKATQTINSAFELAVNSGRLVTMQGLEILLGEVDLQDGHPEHAITHFQKAERISRQRGMNTVVEYLGNIARAEALIGHNEVAKVSLDEAFNLSKDGNGPYLSAAEVYLTLNNREQAQKYALMAYEEAWADGLPYVWWWELERAKAVLDALGVAYPDLPPFDPAKVEPIPYEAEIRVFIEELRQNRREE